MMMEATTGTSYGTATGPMLGAINPWGLLLVGAIALGFLWPAKWKWSVVLLAVWAGHEGHQKKWW
jgi:hypothetical protein